MPILPFHPHLHYFRELFALFDSTVFLLKAERDVGECLQLFKYPLGTSARPENEKILKYNLNNLSPVRNTLLRQLDADIKTSGIGAAIEAIRVRDTSSQRGDPSSALQLYNHSVCE